MRTMLLPLTLKPPGKDLTMRSDFHSSLRHPTRGTDWRLIIAAILAAWAVVSAAVGTGR